MPPRMSFFMTIPQMRAKTKSVTRRVGWWDVENDKPKLEPGDIVIAIEKGQGLKLGQKQTVIRKIETVATRRERLDAITPADCIAEGFPEMSPAEFVAHFKKPPETMVTRIEFFHLPRQLALWV